MHITTLHNDVRFGFLRLSAIKNYPRMLRSDHRELRNSKVKLMWVVVVGGGGGWWWVVVGVSGKDQYCSGSTVRWRLARACQYYISLPKALLKVKLNFSRSSEWWRSLNLSNFLQITITDCNLNIRILRIGVTSRVMAILDCAHLFLRMAQIY